MLLFSLGPDSPGSYLTELATTDRDFSPFNLCLMEPDMNLRKFSAAWYSRSRPDNAVSSEGCLFISTVLTLTTQLSFILGGNKTLWLNCFISRRFQSYN